MGILRYSSIGVDTGRSAVKIVQFRGGKLVKAAAREIPPKIRKGSKEALLSFTRKAVSELIAGGKFHGKFAVAGLAGPSEVQILNFSMPRMSKADMRGAVGIEIRKSAGAELAKGIYDYYLPEISEDGSQKVTAVAADGEAVRGKIRLFENAGLAVTAFLTNGLALQELLNHSDFLEDGKNTLFVNIGAGVTSLNIFKGKTLVISREVTAGSDDITSAMTRSVRTAEGSVDVSYANAENIKKTYGTMEGAPEMVADSVPVSQLSALIRPGIERLIKEITRLTGQFSRESGEVIESVYLCGGGGRMKGLDKLISRETGYKTLPFKLEEIVPAGLSPEEEKLISEGSFDFSVACGLALCKKPAVDLVPSGVKMMQKAANVKRGATAGGLIIALAAGAFYVSLLNRVDEYNALLKDSRTRLEGFSHKIELRDELMSWRERAAARERVYRELSRQPSFYGIFKELSLITPENIFLTRMELAEEARLRVEGVLVSEDMELSRFLTSLENSPFFTDVAMGARTRTAEGGVRFEVSFKLIH